MNYSLLHQKTFCFLLCCFSRFLSLFVVIEHFSHGLLLHKSEWFPLTFGHSNYEPFPAAPKNIPKEGYHDAFHFQTKWKGKKHQKKLNESAYHSSTGTVVVLSMSTVNLRAYWDMVPSKNKNLLWYFGFEDSHDHLMKDFDTLIGTCSNEI